MIMLTCWAHIARIHDQHQCCVLLTVCYAHYMLGLYYWYRVTGVIPRGLYVVALNKWITIVLRRLTHITDTSFVFAANRIC